jgi:hemin uptake protein HemP
MNIPEQTCRWALLSKIADGHASSESDVEFLLDKQEENSMNAQAKNTANEETRVIEAIELLGNSSTAEIRLDDKTYILRRTRQNKLVLNK